MADTRAIRGERLKSFAESVMLESGCSEAESKAVAEVLVEADLRGIYSHGTARLMRYVDHIASGVIRPDTEPTSVFTSRIAAVYDGRGGVGQRVASVAMEKTLELAAANGIGFCSVRNSNHYGIAGYYAEKAVKRGFIGVSTTNTAPLVVPTFSKEPVLGTNPIAVSFPLNSKNFLLDMATSVVPRGKLEVYDRLSKKMPDGWAVDENGNSTNNPTVTLEALLNKLGGILPLGGLGEMFGGHKGFGLSLLVELLTAGLSQGKYSKETYNERGEICHFFGAIDLAMFGDREEIARSFTRIVDEVVNSEKATGQSKIYYHGEKETLKRLQSLEKGVELDLKTVESLDALANKFGINRLKWEDCR
ncbi:MAG: Ldh family oxidoreductase [Thermotogaceae bacterium]|jgi:L-2-hydroxycarboxylate dehydrogenase (NAD+)|nr:Ldh family oxidoreductase [Thermotogaceae bacterium]